MALIDEVMDITCTELCLINDDDLLLRAGRLRKALTTLLTQTGDVGELLDDIHEALMGERHFTNPHLIIPAIRTHILALQAEINYPTHLGYDEGHAEGRKHWEDKVKALEAENEELRRDGERLEWRIKMDEIDEFSLWKSALSGKWLFDLCGSFDPNNHIEYDTPRQAIDAAMEADQ